MTIRNFTSRWGSPLEIYSDNEIHFRTAVKTICKGTQKIQYNEVGASFDQIYWTFNPSADPHMGETCKRLLRFIKKVLRALGPSIKFTDESLRNGLCKVDFIDNSRPLKP